VEDALSMLPIPQLTYSDKKKASKKQMKIEET
jgi:hypothetical protein